MAVPPSADTTAKAAPRQVRASEPWQKYKAQTNNNANAYINTDSTTIGNTSPCTNSIANADNRPQHLGEGLSDYREVAVVAVLVFFGLRPQGARA